MGRYTKIGRGGRVYAVAMGSGFVPWRNLRVPVELESTCGANLGWGRAEGGRKREKRKESLFHSTCVEQQRRSRGVVVI